MSVFKEPWNNNDRAFYLMQNGAITLFMNNLLLEDEIKWLTQHNYVIITLSSDSWNEEMDFHNEISEKLDFPDYYGHNLDALNDCLSDIKTDTEGVVLVFNHYDIFTKKFPDVAKSILDIIERNSRYLLLFGMKMFCLVQTNDPKYHIDNLGANCTNWNQKEWLNKNRGL